MKYFLCLSLLLTVYFTTHYASANSATEIAVNSLLNEHLDSVCQKYPSLPEITCNALITAGARSVAGLDVDTESLKKTVADDLKKPEFLNSILNKAYNDNIPLGLEFKNLDSEQGESVLGLSYTYDYNFFKQDRRNKIRWRERTELSFHASGTLTNNSDENPRNFLDTTLSFSNAYTTRIPVQNLDFGTKLSGAAGQAAAACAGPNGASSDSCKEAKKAAFELLDSTSDFLKAFQRYEIGINIGYESDQKFDATQSKFGAFINGQYESWGEETLIGGINIRPSFRLAVDKLDPNDETPRALAGDDSSYYRYNAEVALWMPIGSYFDQRLALTYSYRRYGEIDASTIVKSANLDTYNLRTFSLSNPSGLFVSYSSGSLPLDQQSDDVLEIGWKTYF